MADYDLLGLYHEATPTADTIDRLRRLGVPGDRITVLSGMPYRPEMLGRPAIHSRIALWALVGAIAGLLLGFVLTAGLFLLYPLNQGGQPLIPIPPTLIVLFESAMLGTMWAAFFGLLLENRFPTFRPLIHDPRISEGHIGVVARVSEGLAGRAEEILKSGGAHHLARVEVQPGPYLGFRKFWLGVLTVLALATIVMLIAAYDILSIPFPTQMAEQISIAPQQGPRLAAPQEAVPIQGPVMIDNQPASEPIPSSSSSLQRGSLFYSETCIVCHGATGVGNGTVGAFFNPKPVDLTGPVAQNLTDNALFVVITKGFGVMPSMAENLSPQDRWHVINYVRSLKK